MKTQFPSTFLFIILVIAIGITPLIATITSSKEAHLSLWELEKCVLFMVNQRIMNTANTY